MISTLLDGNNRFVAEQIQKEQEYPDALQKEQRPTVQWIGYPDPSDAENNRNRLGWISNTGNGQIKVIQTEQPHKA